MARKRTISLGRDYIDIYGNLHRGYTHRTKSGKHQLNMAYELREVLNEYANELIHEKEIALDKASDFLLVKLEQNSPVSNDPSRSGTFKRSWLRTDKYTGVRYIGNSAVGSKNEYGYDIPLSNLIEFSSKGKPFIRRTFDDNREEIIRIIKGELENNGKRQ